MFIATTSRYQNKRLIMKLQSIPRNVGADSSKLVYIRPGHYDLVYPGKLTKFQPEQVHGMGWLTKIILLFQSSVRSSLYLHNSGFVNLKPNKRANSKVQAKMSAQVRIDSIK
jgi:hypothetical protein